MNHRPVNLETMLAELGEARSAGVFEGSTVGRPFPWQKAARSEAGPSLRRGRIPRVAAVAAAVGFGIVAVWHFESSPRDSAPAERTTGVQFARNDVTASKPGVTPGTAGAVGDLNGDGSVDGDDIQVFVKNRAENSRGGVDSTKDASEFARLLIGS